jgi:SsrA-binding protein
MQGTKLVTKNRKAFHDYEIIERHEAGMVLVGTEVKSLRDGRCNLKDSYARVDGGELILHGTHISPYEPGNRNNHEPERPRKLLMHKREIYKLAAEVGRKGMTLVPLSVYFKSGRAKVEIGLAKGKAEYDKRDTLKQREESRDVAQALKAAHQL